MSMTKRNLDSKLTSAKKELESLLSSLGHEVEMARRALKRGEHLNTRMMSNHLSIDTLSDKVNTLGELFELVEAEEEDK